MHLLLRSQLADTFIQRDLQHMYYRDCNLELIVEYQIVVLSYGAAGRALPVLFRGSNGSCSDEDIIL